MLELLTNFLSNTGFANLTWQYLVMIGMGCLLLYLGIVRGFEPLLLVPIGFGCILCNLPITGLMDEGGLLKYFYFGVEHGLFPPIIFLGIGAMTDFGPLLANPITFLLGAAAQLGIFATLIGAKALGFTFCEAASIGIIGGADGPTAIFLTSKLAPHLLGPIAVAAYSYMALVPFIQPPIIKALTSKKDRMIHMAEVRQASKTAKILFPIIVCIIASLLVPDAASLLGMLMLGNLMKECGVTERLTKTFLPCLNCRLAAANTSSHSSLSGSITVGITRRST